MTPLLDNIFWHALVGAHSRYATGANGARRYAPGFSPIVGFANVEQPDLGSLIPYCEVGEHFYCGGWTGGAPSDWRVETETSMFRMVWDAPAPKIDDLLEAVALGPRHVPQLLELTALTRPGPFGPRTIELGEYFGCFDGERLVAMAGERAHAGSLREISGVCTHPDFQGRGLARRLMLKLILRQIDRGETPFLHVMRDNVSARQLYARMGFRDYGEAVVRVFSRRP